jgi:hypothetical protein
MHPKGISDGQGNPTYEIQNEKAKNDLIKN